MALFASIIGGLAGYGTGALMPLVLVPLVGAEPVVPIIAISATFTNSSRAIAYLRYADRRRAGARLCASDRGDCHSRRLPRQGFRRADAGAHPHRDPRRRGCHGRIGDDLGGGEAAHRVDALTQLAFAPRSQLSSAHYDPQ